MELTYGRIKYGMLVEVLDKVGGGYHAGCKVYFFNKKGVLVGNLYEFIPYNRLRLRWGRDRQYPRYFMGKNYLNKRTPFAESIKMLLFVSLCNIITGLIKFTQKFMD